MEPIRIRMLGQFSIESESVSISDTGNRSKKVWSLLAYLLCNRDRSFSIQTLTALLWGDNDTIANPENALRITLHRLRSLLDRLWDGAGRELIIRREEGYGWNSSIPVVLDCEQFEELYLQTSCQEDARLETALEALSLYQGEFLPKHNSEMWIIPLSTHFQNQYLLLSIEAAQLLSARGRHKEAIRICQAASETEPYHEQLHQILMQEMAAEGNLKGAAAVYENLSQVLFDAFGIRPSEETRTIYRTAVHRPEDREFPMDEVLEDLQEPESKSGAMQCDYDYFKVLCYAQARSMEREGNVSHIALFRLSSADDKPLSKRSRERNMESFGDTLRTNLRQGDVISRCSISQYIMMLPNANYENSCMVCRRVIGAFHNSHPRAAVTVKYMVQPLIPRMHVPR